MNLRRLIRQAWSWFRRRVFCSRGKHKEQRWNVGQVAGWQCTDCTVMATVIEVQESRCEKSE